MKGGPQPTYSSVPPTLPPAGLAPVPLFHSSREAGVPPSPGALRWAGPGSHFSSPLGRPLVMDEHERGPGVVPGPWCGWFWGEGGFLHGAQGWWREGLPVGPRLGAGVTVEGAGS